jgi:hypothetical protein
VSVIGVSLDECVGNERRCQQAKRHRPYCLRRRDRLHSRFPLSQERGMVRRVARPNPDCARIRLRIRGASRRTIAAFSLRRRAALLQSRTVRMDQPAPGRGPSVASGGAPTSPESVAANHSRGRHTGRGPELPGAVQEGRPANLHRTPSFVPPPRRLMKRPSADER